MEEEVPSMKLSAATEKNKVKEIFANLVDPLEKEPHQKEEQNGHGYKDGVTCNPQSKDLFFGKSQDIHHK